MPVYAEASTAESEDQLALISQVQALDARFRDKPMLYAWRDPQRRAGAQLAELVTFWARAVEPEVFLGTAYGQVVTTNYDPLIGTIGEEQTRRAQGGGVHDIGLLLAAHHGEPTAARSYNPERFRNTVQRVCRWVSSASAETAPETGASSEGSFPEWDWIEENGSWIREKFAGLWIAVTHDSLVAIGVTEVEVLKLAADLGYERVFTFYVPTGSEAVVVAAV